MDYSGFANAFGGDWAARLRLVWLPACALTTPADSACQTATPLRTTNDKNAATVTASVPLAADGSATVLAATAAPSGDSGDYTATNLTPASTWQVSAQTGAFSWSYPLSAVPGVGGPEPSLAIGYSSGSVDGRTSMTNSQGSWIGDGWDMWPGFIERSYRPCADDRDPVGGQDPNNKNNPTGDLCWFSLNGTMSLNGRSVELVRGGDGRWHGTSDDASRIELLNDGSFANGDTDGEYWRVTTIDGTQYFFGRNRKPGWTSGQAETNSVWTVPVYGNHPGEPCHAATFNPGHCGQAWRWNLDYVIDPHGNTMTYFYERETGAYGRELNPSLRTTYVRGGWMRQIEYGSRSDTEYSTWPVARVILVRQS